MMMDRRQCLAALAAFAAGGCSLTAKRPPTPARFLDVSGLEDPLPGEHYYVTLFGSQVPVKRPRYAHTFAAALHVRCAAEGESVVEKAIISWMPATQVTRPLWTHPEPGQNFSLPESMEWAVRTNQRIYQYGPYECRPRLYHRFVAQQAYLESGAIQYQCLDGIGISAQHGKVADCIHAITDMDPDYGRFRYLSTRFGASAARYIVRQLCERDAVTDCKQTYPELNAHLGISDFPILARSFCIHK